MLLNILQCTGEPPQQRVIWTQMLIVPGLRRKVDTERKDRRRQKKECGVCVPTFNTSQGKEEEGKKRVH